MNKYSILQYGRYFDVWAVDLNDAERFARNHHPNWEQIYDFKLNFSWLRY